MAGLEDELMKDFYNKVNEFSAELFFEDVNNGSLFDVMDEFKYQPINQRLGIYMLGAVSLAQAIKEGRFKV